MKKSNVFVKICSNLTSQVIQLTVITALTLQLEPLLPNHPDHPVVQSSLNFIFKAILSRRPFPQIYKFKPTAGPQFDSFSLWLICWVHHCSVSNYAQQYAS